MPAEEASRGTEMEPKEPVLKPSAELLEIERKGWRK